MWSGLFVSGTEPFNNLLLYIIEFYFVIALRALKHITIILLTIGISLPDSLVHQVMRVPALAVHYFHHLTEHEEIGVIDFLVLHYGDSEHMKTDAHEHQNLPGTKSHHACQHVSPAPVVIQSLQLALVHPQLSGVAHPIAMDEFVPSNGANSIWQPPKLA